MQTPELLKKFKGLGKLQKDMSAFITGKKEY